MEGSEGQKEEGEKEREGKGRGQDGGKGLRRKEGWEGKRRTYSAGFSRFLRHLARKQSRSILSTRALSPHGADDDVVDDDDV